MTQPGYQAGSEPMWWWKVAQHLDETQLALANAMSHNVDDPQLVHALQDRLREGQAVLFEIFRAKGLLPGATNGKADVPPGMPMQGMPGMPMPGMSMPEMPAPPVPPPPGGWWSGPSSAVSEAPVTAPTSEPPQDPPLAADEPAVPEADHVAAPTDAEPPIVVSSEDVVPAPIVVEAPPAVAAAEPDAGGAG